MEVGTECTNSSADIHLTLIIYQYLVFLGIRRWDKSKACKVHMTVVK